MVSVVIPCFNDGEYIRETYDKLIEQTYSDFEVIIVNDGSNDEHTVKVLKSMENLPKLTIYHTPNQKMAAARNFGIAKSKGDLIVALDADDYFDKTFFQKAVKILNNSTEVGVVSSYVQHFGLNNKTFKPRGGNVKNFLFSNQCPMCCMFKRKVWEKVGGLDEKMLLGYEDWDFFLRVTNEGFQVKIIPEFLFFYRQTKESTLSNETHPNMRKILTYMIDKNIEIYKKYLIDLIIDKEVIFTDARISWQNIIKMTKNRIVKKYD